MAAFFAGDFFAAAERSLVYFAGFLRAVFLPEDFFEETALVARFAGALRAELFFVATFFVAAFFVAFLLAFTAIQITSGIRIASVQV